MRNLNIELKNKKINYNKLIDYGFEKKEDKYIYKTKICDNQFEMIVTFSNEEKMSKLIDIENDEEYVLVDIEDSVGSFVGKIKEEYDNRLKLILNECTDIEIFKEKQSKEIIKYIEDKYKDKPEFLWKKFDDVAAIRNKQNNKWYAVLMKIKEEKLGIKSDKEVEVIDLRYEKGKVEQVVDNKKIFPGYHMNKNSWITIKLDNLLDTKTILKLIDDSYKLSIGNKCKITGDELSKKVFDYLTTIPKGKVVTYKQVAEYLGNKGLARVVGSILHKNPDGDKYPCYKVLNSKGELAEAFVFGGKEIQKQRLEKDGIRVTDYKVDLKTYQWK